MTGQPTAQAETQAAATGASAGRWKRWPGVVILVLSVGLAVLAFVEGNRASHAGAGGPSWVPPPRDDGRPFGARGVSPARELYVRQLDAHMRRRKSELGEVHDLVRLATLVFAAGVIACSGIALVGAPRGVGRRWLLGILMAGAVGIFGWSRLLDTAAAFNEVFLAWAGVAVVGIVAGIALLAAPPPVVAE